MKHSIKLIILFIALSMTTACSDFLNVVPEDTPVADNFFKSKEAVRSATAYLYSGTPWFPFNDKFFWLASDCQAGDLYYTATSTGEGQFFYMIVRPANSHLFDGWTGLYRVIGTCNSVINDMPPAAIAYVDEETINKAVAEARFIRAMAYYLLAEFWGEVPIVDNSIKYILSNNLYLNKNTRQSVYEFVRRDLEFAKENLPLTDDPGRVTTWSARAMLAKLHLTMASTLSSSESSANFQKAKDYAADVIKNSGLMLMTQYADLFKMQNKNSGESLFAIQLINGGWGEGNSRQANWARNSIITKNDEAWGQGKCGTFDFMNSYEPGDLRKNPTIMTLGAYYPEINKSGGGYTYNIVSYNNEGEKIEDASALLNNLKKYVMGSAEDTDGLAGSNQATAMNQYLLRLADVYLTYAEATLGDAQSTNDATALNYFNAIRKRAGLSAKASINFMDILKERRAEFGMESMSWFDVKRFFYRDENAAVQYLIDQKREQNYRRISGGTLADENSMSGYELTYPDNPMSITKALMYLPIPESEMVTNPKFSEPAVDYVFE